MVYYDQLKLLCPESDKHLIYYPTSYVCDTPHFFIAYNYTSGLLTVVHCTKAR